jgi:hypothetical protein
MPPWVNSGTPFVLLLMVVNHEWGKDRIVIKTKGIHPCWRKALSCLKIVILRWFSCLNVYHDRRIINYMFAVLIIFMVLHYANLNIHTCCVRSGAYLSIANLSHKCDNDTFLGGNPLCSRMVENATCIKI